MRNLEEIRSEIAKGEAVLGIELGSTRIKAVLIGTDHAPIASGGHTWENSYENGVWTYSLDEVWSGLQDCYKALVSDVTKQYGIPLKKVKAMGLSAMMHGYLAFDKEDRQLVPFRTWRNTITAEAAAELTKLFNYNIPQRWSIAHLYQCVLNKEEHVKDVDFFTTLSGYVHWKLTGNKVIGIGDASGMFPIDTQRHDYRADMIEKFNVLMQEHGIKCDVKEMLPKILVAGENAGNLTKEGALLIDPSGELEAGIPLCAPEGDAGTGMAATNSVAVRTGNVSAGTSIFAMLVLEKELSKVYTQIDMVTTPSGDLVAMSHANNCTSDLNAWVGLFGEFAGLFGIKADIGELFSKLYGRALDADPDCGGLLSYGYYSGENVIELDEGRPLFVRTADSRFNLANFMRVHLFAAMGALKIGMDILMKDEHVKVDKILGHGGLFKTKGVAQRLMAGALEIPVSVMSTAGEGGAWGIALLAAYMAHREGKESLAEYLSKKVFAGSEGEEIAPVPEDVEGFKQFMKHFEPGLEIEKAAVKYFR